MGVAPSSHLRVHSFRRFEEAAVQRCGRGGFSELPPQQINNHCKDVNLFLLSALSVSASVCIWVCVLVELRMLSLRFCQSVRLHHAYISVWTFLKVLRLICPLRGILRVCDCKFHCHIKVMEPVVVSV